MTQHNLPVDVLEQRASEQRRQLHNDLAELRSTVREKLDVRRNVEPYALPAAGVATLVGLGLGYVVTGMFTD